MNGQEQEQRGRGGEGGDDGRPYAADEREPHGERPEEELHRDPVAEREPGDAARSR